MCVCVCVCVVNSNSRNRRQVCKGLSHQLFFVHSRYSLPSRRSAGLLTLFIYTDSFCQLAILRASFDSLITFFGSSSLSPGPCWRFQIKACFVICLSDLNLSRFFFSLQQTINCANLSLAGSSWGFLIGPWPKITQKTMKLFAKHKPIKLFTTCVGSSSITK